MAELLVGIDVGTQGARAVCTTPAGEVVARTAAPLVAPPPGPAQEQDPRDWWNAVASCLQQLADHRADVAGLAVACTSGTLCALDDRFRPIANAWLYSDTRAAGRSRFDASWAAAQLDWLCAEHPDLAQTAALFTSPGGYLASRLTGTLAAIDYSQALKFGYDLKNDGWLSDLAVQPDRLPPVVAPGSPLGPVCPEVARGLGLGEKVQVFAGLTDGVAAQLACGGCSVGSGRWVTVVGSTLVWKGAANEPVDDATVGVYSHRGPGGVWFPGAASNAGGRILSEWFDDARLPELDARLPDGPPKALVYPSLIVGERFPFRSTTFVPFAIPDGLSEDERYAGCLAGVAFVERWGYDVLRGLGLWISGFGGHDRGRGAQPRLAAAARRRHAGPPRRARRARLGLRGGHCRRGEPSRRYPVCGRRHGEVGGGVDPRPEHGTEWSDAYERFKNECRRRIENEPEDGQSS